MNRTILLAIILRDTGNLLLAVRADQLNTLFPKAIEQMALSATDDSLN